MGRGFESVRQGTNRCVGQVAEGVQGTEEKGPGLRAEAGGSGEEAFQRSFLCAR